MQTTHRRFDVTRRSLPREILEAAERIAEYARREGLDFYPTIFEMLSPDEMAQVAAYGGFPQRYPHWRFGMEYERLRKQHRYGLGRIYEMVINNNPCYAYLLNDNMMVDHKTVIAHVFAHCDFFKNNIWFSRTDRRMIDTMANHATRIRRYMDRYGVERVERLIDTFLSLENLIDPHSMFMKRSKRKPPAEKAKSDDAPVAVRFPAKTYMDRYINPPDRLALEREKEEREKRSSKERFPDQPTRDVLLFLLQHAPLEDWEADVLSIIREEAYYFAPQGMTKIMNEGWASYWHSTIMTRYVLGADEVVDYCEHHAGTLATSPGRLNPYKLGIELFRDIEHRWNTGRYGPEYEACDDMARRRDWGKDKTPPGPVVGRGSPGREKIFEVRRLYNDVMFLDEFLTPEFMKEQKLYHYRMDPATGRIVVVNRDFDKIKNQLLFMLTNHAQPYIFVMDGNYRNRGELYLAHRHTGADLDIKYAQETLKQIHKVWKRPVHLSARIDDEPILFTFDGEQSSQQHIDEHVDPPAHQF
ncbi:MAG: SpoVR family protein [Planctomycetota bacterium]|nr:MAG: SpoVR family protein [Planctomycetota bacterium]